MKLSIMNIKIILSISFLFLLLPKTAYAYLDPGTGSYLFQLLIAGFLGGTFFIKTVFRKVKKLFKNNSSNENQ